VIPGWLRERGNAGTEHKWRVQRAAAVEKALQGAPASLASVVAAVRAVQSNVKPGKMADADFLTSTAEGLLFEALVATLSLVRASLIREDACLRLGDRDLEDCRSNMSYLNMTT